MKEMDLLKNRFQNQFSFIIKRKIISETIFISSQAK